MRFTQLVFRTMATLVAAVALATLAFAAEGFVGKYVTKDTNGEAFTIWLSDNGSAKGDRANEGLQGMWKEEGNAAVITWDSGWVTKITKEGDAYKKTAEKDGKPVGDAVEAKKVE
ncbi:MAG TPA: hypothetical protein VNJ31_01510 [Methyloceanibacter sp.]|nr:hypothetical protein [Methyloceanibacter sp.]